ncbi:MAG TPA: Cu(I)-responsive transcriptional regulator, partial [Dongiaceae bacterium]|nr:Cu(I)-responsive transcriptional regulator [Dongiaceae bacterium]
MASSRSQDMEINIGRLARRTSVPAKTIRYYESIGLIPRARRSGGNYRTYGERDVTMLRFIHRARRLGFSVADVEKLLALWRDQRRPSAKVRELALAHIAEIDGKLAELQSIRRTLAHLAQSCRGDERPDCPILDDLAEGKA